MSRLIKLPRTAFLGLGIALLAGGVFVQVRIGAAEETPRIAFLRLTENYWQLWMMDEDGRRPRQLTTSPVDKHSPSWCPGNEVVHFSTSRGDNVLLDLATGIEHPQLPAITAFEPPHGPDGSLLPFDVDVRKLLVEKGFEQFVGVTCGDEHRLPEIVEIRVPDAMPEGKGIVVQKRLSRELKPIYEINVADVGDSASIKSTPWAGERADGRRVVSKDGAVAYVSARSGGDEIWSSKRNELPKRITDFAAKTANPFWSHDGNFLYFDSDFAGTVQIYRALGNGEAIQLVSDGAASSRGGVLSWPVEKRAQR